jgi:hypothetical protein
MAQERPLKVAKFNVSEPVEVVPTPLENSDVLQRIISFVGPNQYRFVAEVNHDFKAAYCYIFPDDKRTYYNASTVNHAKSCYECPKISPDNTTKLCTSAARHGCISALMYLRWLDVSWDCSTSSTAAKFGRLHILQYLHANGCPWNSETCSSAAAKGHLHVLKWAHENGCPWDEGTCIVAAWGGHLKLLKWARANGCPWDASTCFSAAAKGRFATLRWALANDCPWIS